MLDLGLLRSGEVLRLFWVWTRIKTDLVRQVILAPEQDRLDNFDHLRLGPDQGRLDLLELVQNSVGQAS